MGPQRMPVDLPPPHRINGDPAPRSEAKDRSSSFDGYLDDARSAVATKPAEKIREAPRNDAKPPADADVDKDDVQAAPSPDKDEAEETKAREPVVVATAPVPVAVLTPDQKPDADESPAEFSSSNKKQPVVVAQERTPEAPEAKPTEQLPADSSQQSETRQQEAKAPGRSSELPVNQGARLAPASEETARSDPAVIKTPIEQPHGDHKRVDAPTNRVRKAADQTTAADQNRAREEAVAEQPVSNSKRLDQIVPDQSQASDRIRLRKEPVTELPQSPPKRVTLLNADQNRTRQDTVRATNHAPVPVTIKSGRGDGAAASFARFLITAADQNAAGSSGNAPASVSTEGIAQATGNAAPAVTAGPAPVADLVADLLAARVDDADAIKGAARVLNASGRSGKHQVTMQLDPPDLGQLKLQIQMNAQGLSLRVDAQTHAVAKMIESRLTELSDALAIHGIRVDRAEVTVRPAASTHADTQASQDNARSGQGDFNQPSNQNHGDGNQGEAPPQWTAGRQLSDPNHAAEDLGGGPYQDDLAALTELGEKSNDPITPATELSVNLVA